MSRVSYVMMNPDGRGAMTNAVREAVNGLIGKVCAEGGVDRLDIFDTVFVCNPIMHHLFLGIDPTELGQAPFALAVSGPVQGWTHDIGIDVSRGGRFYMLPCIAGHVGADAAGATLSEGPYRQDRMMLLVDVGTNAEIVLGNRANVVAASSPTGPAFEGAEISSGQRAAPGAIERVRIDPVTLEPKYRVIGVDKWSDEEGFEEAAKATGVTGICGSAIIEVVAEMYLSGLISEDGVIDGALAARTPRIIQNGRTFSYLLRERAKTKAKLVVIDPRLTPTGAQADEWIAPKPHTDLALALAFLQHVIASGLYDKAFVARWVTGFDELKKHLAENGYTPEWAEKVTGVQMMAFSRAIVPSGVESGNLERREMIRDPDNILAGQWQVANGAFYFVNGAHKLRVMKANP